MRPMKHIKEILAERQASLFGDPQEKGSGEWHTFNVVRNDTVGAYRVKTPHIAQEPRYPNTVRINRHLRPRRLESHPLVLKQG